MIAFEIECAFIKKQRNKKRRVSGGEKYKETEREKETERDIYG